MPAAEWRIAPSFGTTLVGESNPGLVAVPTTSQQALAAEAGLRLQGRTEITEFGLNAAAARREYRVDSLNRSDLSVDASLAHASSERTSWSARIAATRDSTLTSELGTSGQSRADYRHESIGASLSPEWQWGERWTAAMTAQWRSDFYPSTDSSLVDYQYISGMLTSSWRRSARDSIGIVLHTGRLSVAQAPADVEDASASLQYARTIAELWSLSLAAGPAWARGAGSTETGETFSMEVTRDGQYGAVSFSADRSIAPTGNGYLTRRDSLAVQMHRKLVPNLSGSLGTRYLRSRTVIGALGFTFDDVRYRRVEAGLSWTVTPQWVADFRAGYADQTQQLGRSTGTGADFSLGIRWSGKNHVL